MGCDIRLGHAACRECQQSKVSKPDPYERRRGNQQRQRMGPGRCETKRTQAGEGGHSLQTDWSRIGALGHSFSTNHSRKQRMTGCSAAHLFASSLSLCLCSLLFPLFSLSFSSSFVAFSFSFLWLLLFFAFGWFAFCFFSFHPSADSVAVEEGDSYDGFRVSGCIAGGDCVYPLESRVRRPTQMNRSRRSGEAVALQASSSGCTQPPAASDIDTAVRVPADGRQRIDIINCTKSDHDHRRVGMAMEDHRVESQVE